MQIGVDSFAAAMGETTTVGSPADRLRDLLDEIEHADLVVESLPEDLDLNNGRAILFDPGTQIAALRKAITDAPKYTRWKLRARVGERQSWYQEPEEMGHN